MNLRRLVIGIIVGIFVVPVVTSGSRSSDKYEGKEILNQSAEAAERGQLFRDGNYAMFIHWGIYSNLANRYQGETYYGIGEWIMNDSMAGIPVEEYKEVAKTFNPHKFVAEAIVQLARDAGMKYIVITSKHHDGFAMYDSKASDFNIVDTTPYKKDPMKELAAACREAGLGFGFYYSHNQDWTFASEDGVVETADSGAPVDFDTYFREKCLPQVEEITTQYGPIEIVWFDTPRDMPKKYVEKLVEVVRKNQPNALVSGRAGHGLGDYKTLGDMHVPKHNIEGMWETVDTTNDSWGYAWYDENWKTPKEIVKRVVATVARGGTYMLNIGPKGDGTVPERAQWILRESGKWVHRYPEVVYGTDASPWQHAMPWGDITVRDNLLYLTVFDWPDSGKFYLPGLKTSIDSVYLLDGDHSKQLKHQNTEGWTIIDVPPKAPEKLATVIKVKLEGSPVVNLTFGLDPVLGVELFSEFAKVKDATQEEHRWMEKFGEWIQVVRVHDWQSGGKATWEIDVLKAGNYEVMLTHAGEGRIVWGINVEGGEHIQNQQDSSHNYQEYPIGWIHFPEPGKYTISASVIDDSEGAASLHSIRLVPVK